MKKVLSLITAFVLTAMLAIPAFAADAIKFNLTLVSETDTEAVITVDYAGGSTFNALDFEIKLSNKVTVTKAVKSEGLSAFIDAAQENGQLAMSAINKDKNPLIGTLATTLGFNTSHGKDLYKITLKKNAKDKLTSEDVKMTVTNCAISDANGSTKELSASVTSDLGKAVTSALSNKGTVATDKNGKPISNAETTTAADEVTTTEAAVITPDEDGDIVEDIPEVPTSKGNKIADKISAFANSSGKNKIIIISALAICCILIIVVVVVAIAKKTGKENADSADNSEDNGNKVE